MCVWVSLECCSSSEDEENEAAGGRSQDNDVTDELEPIHCKSSTAVTDSKDDEQQVDTDAVRGDNS